MQRIVSIKFGSHLYGTATEKSDLDLKHVYLPHPIEIILQKVRPSIVNKRPKGESEKNFAGEVDEESYSLQRYLQLLQEGQTVALDMLFAPSQFRLGPPHLVWSRIVGNKDKFLSKKSAAFIGYCRTQANKYGIKGSRVHAVRMALELLNTCIDGAVLHYYWEDILKLVIQNEHMLLIDIEQPGGNIIRHWEICGRKFGETTTIKQVKECLQKIMDNYGKRSLLAEYNEGVDWKALSHAVRVARQAIELFQTGNITFPLPYAAHILAIKTGTIEYKLVADEIERLLEDVEHEAKKSTLPDEPDYAFADQLILEVYGTICHS